MAENEKKKENEMKTVWKKHEKQIKSSDPFNFLTELNEYLEEVPASTLAAFDNYADSMEHWSQDKVDIACAWLAWKVNVLVENARRKGLKALHGFYMSLTSSPQAKAARVALEFVQDPLGTLGSWADTIAKPAKEFLKWVQMLIVEVPKLAANLANIASALPPSPPSPHINFSKFKLKIGSISMADITQDPSMLPPIDQMFPEPTRPHNEKSFDEAFNKRPEKKKIKYSLKENKEMASSVKDLTDTISEGNS